MSRRWAVLWLAVVACGSCSPQGGHDHGTRRDLGEAQAGPFTVSLVTYGDLEPGAEVALDLRLSGAIVRASHVNLQLSNDAGDGTLLQRLPREEGSHFHAHLPVPEGLPADVQWRVEVVTESGERHPVTFRPGE